MSTEVVIAIVILGSLSAWGIWNFVSWLREDWAENITICLYILAICTAGAAGAWAFNVLLEAGT